MRLVFFCFLFLQCLNLKSQESNITDIVDRVYQAEEYHNKGVSLARVKKFAESIPYYDTAQLIRNSVFPKLDIASESEREVLLTGYIKSSHNIGVAYAYIEKLDQAEYYTRHCIKKQLEFLDKYNFFIPLRLGRAYCQLGKVFMKTKGFDQAYTQLKLGEYYLSQVTPTPRQDMRLLENTYSNLFLIWKEVDSLFVHSKIQLDIWGRNQNSTKIGTALVNLGICMEMKDEYEVAVDYFQSALEIYRVDSVHNEKMIALIYHNQAYVYAKLGKWNQAQASILMAKKLTSSFEASAGIRLEQAKIHNTQGFIYYLAGDFQSSVAAYERTLQNNGNDAEIGGAKFTDRFVEEIDTLFSLDKTVLLFALGYRAKGLAHSNRHDEAKPAFTLAINYLNKIRREYNDTESKLKLTEIAKVIFEGAIALHLDPAVNEPEKAFAYAEQSRAFTLLEGVKHSKAMRIARVPTALLDQEYQARADIAHLERQYLSAKTPEEKTERLQAIRSEKEALNTLMSKLQRNKEYRKLMSFEAPAVKKLRRKALGTAQTLVEYFVGEEKTYVFVLPKKGPLKVLQLEVGSKALNQQVDEFWSSIYHYGCDQEVLQREAPALAELPKSERQAYLKATYRRTGQELYRLLFQPIVDLGTGERFVIIPDEGLSYLPFDALLQGEPEIDNFSFYPYLGRDYTLSYAYSGNLLLEMQGGRSSNARKILAMAPSFSSRQLAMNKSALARLTNNETEINVICDIFSDECDPKSGEAASRETFLDLIKDNAYRIIHLSTHGKANDKNPNQSWISFTQKNQRLDESELLYASDLYALPIQADLVVLSACETNKGRLRRGEGIMSFARGLSAAGVKSVLSTFWVIGEDPSLLVMKDFYQALNAGAAKDVALQKARLGLMENSDFSHPFYWSAFVPIGQMSEVSSGGSLKWMLLGLGVLLLIFVFPKLNKHWS